MANSKRKASPAWRPGCRGVLAGRARSFLVYRQGFSVGPSALHTAFKAPASNLHRCPSAVGRPSLLNDASAPLICHERGAGDSSWPWLPFPRMSRPHLQRALGPWPRSCSLLMVLKRQVRSAQGGGRLWRPAQAVAGADSHLFSPACSGREGWHHHVGRGGCCAGAQE